MERRKWGENKFKSKRERIQHYKENGENRSRGNYQKKKKKKKKKERKKRQTNRN